MSYLTFIYYQSRDAGLLAPHKELNRANLPLYLRVAPEDPGAGLTLLRREIELQLVDIAKARGLQVSEETTLFELIGVLKKTGILTKTQAKALSHLRRALNTAVHSRNVEKDSAKWVYKFGPPVLAALELLLISSRLC